ncbi:hypothetical protein TURU_017488 [Turdus rufiventris]|nr:hypothetical protein TURU_017488 [Turdus rufiventris]
MTRRGEAETNLFSAMTSYKSQGNGLKLCQGRFRLDIGKMFSIRKMDGHWNRLPRDVVSASSLVEPKKTLDNTLKIKDSVVQDQELDLMIFERTFNSAYSVR